MTCRPSVFVSVVAAAGLVIDTVPERPPRVVIPAREQRAGALVTGGLGFNPCRADRVEFKHQALVGGPARR